MIIDFDAISCFFGRIFSPITSFIWQIRNRPTKKRLKKEVWYLVSLGAVITKDPAYSGFVVSYKVFNPFLDENISKVKEKAEEILQNGRGDNIQMTYFKIGLIHHENMQKEMENYFLNALKEEKEEEDQKREIEQNLRKE